MWMGSGVEDGQRSDAEAMQVQGYTEEYVTLGVE
jgi:hypothetical protein